MRRHQSRPGTVLFDTLAGDSVSSKSLAAYVISITVNTMGSLSNAQGVSDDPFSVSFVHWLLCPW